MKWSWLAKLSNSSQIPRFDRKTKEIKIGVMGRRNIPSFVRNPHNILYVGSTWCIFQRQSGPQQAMTGQDKGTFPRNPQHSCIVDFLHSSMKWDPFWKFISSLNLAKKWFNSKLNSKQNPKCSFKKYSFNRVKNIQ